MRSRRGERAAATESLVMGRVAKVGVILGVLTAVTGLVDWAVGHFGGVDRAPAPRIDARIMSVTARHGAETLGDYVRETRPTPAPRYTAAQLREPGLVLAVRVRIRGAQGKRFPLRWAMYDDARGRLRGPAYNQLGATFVPEAQEHARTWPVWVPQPPGPGRYHVRFTLDDPAGRPTDDQDSPSITGR